MHHPYRKGPASSLGRARPRLADPAALGHVRERSLGEPLGVGLVDLAAHLARVDKLETCRGDGEGESERDERMSGRRRQKEGRTLHGRERERGREAGCCGARDGLDRRDAALGRLGQFCCGERVCQSCSSGRRARVRARERETHPCSSPRQRWPAHVHSTSRSCPCPARRRTRPPPPRPRRT